MQRQSVPISPAGLAALARTVRIAAALIAIGGLAFVWLTRPLGSVPPQPAQEARIGSLAPDVRLESLDGPRTLSELRGKSVVLNFWATWCPPCKAEMPALDAAGRENAQYGVVVMGVDQQDDVDTVREFMAKSGLGFPTMLDPDAVAATLYRVRAMPTTYFIDRNGVIRDIVYGGPMPRALIDTKIAALLRP